jgi:hypothetical protein
MYQITRITVARLPAGRGLQTTSTVLFDEDLTRRDAIRTSSSTEETTVQPHE